MALAARFGAFENELRGTDDTGNPNDISLRSTLFVIAARHHFGDGLAAELQIPTGTIRLDRGRGIRANYVSGLGDIQIAGRYDLAALWGAGGYQPSVIVHAGLGLPTGKRARLDGGPLPPSLISIGNAAFGFTGSVQATQHVSPAIAVKAWAGARQPLSPTEEGIQIGRAIDYGVGGSFRAMQWLSLAGQLSATQRAYSEEQLEGTLLNSGGQWIAAELAATVWPNERVAFSLGAHLPLSSDVNGTQISETFALRASLAMTFGAEETPKEAHTDHKHEDGGPDEHHDGHAHNSGAQTDAAGQLAAWAGHEPESLALGDIVNVAIGGATFKLESALAAGKITVIDFWADWCEPCHVIDDVLWDLAAEYDNLAIRRAEVPDFDSAIVKDHLPTTNGLPVVWIFDAQGTKQHTLESTSAAEVAEHLRRMLSGE